MYISKLGMELSGFRCPGYGICDDIPIGKLLDYCFTSINCEDVDEALRQLDISD